MRDAVINVEHLVKVFAHRRVVDDISFHVERGEILGFIGPNGAGKSTTMRIITGFYPPSSGVVTVGGYDVTQNATAAKRLIGYLPENAPAYAEMTVAAFLNFVAEVRGLGGAAKTKAVNRVVEICLLENVLYQTIDTLSKGYKHRTALAQAIIHDPPILILDEPTDGLDPNQKHEVRGLIRRMGESKVIVFSTHILEEVEEVCTRVIIIDRGRLVANDTPEGLKKRSQLAGAVRLAVRGVGPAVVKQKLSPLAARTELISSDSAQVVMRAYPAESSDGAFVGRVADLALHEAWKVDEIHVEEGRLDEVFRSITLPDTVVVAPR